MYKPPENIAKRDPFKKYVFLAGTIDMGNSYDWQTDMNEFFDKYDWDTFNPRRTDWNADWTQKYENPQFFQQVKWELNALEKSNIILMYFAAGSASPISLVEFGMYMRSKKIYVVCPEEFYRNGNVEIYCEEFDIPVFENFVDFKEFFKLRKDLL